MKFGIYYIPPEGEFYSRGSQILGYDIRNASQVHQPEWVHPDWVASARPYGFHLTITDAVETLPENLNAIETGLEKILGCFSENCSFSLKFNHPAASFFSTSNKVAVLPMQLSTPVAVLHTALVCRIQSLGSGSFYSTVSKDRSAFSTTQMKRIELFHGPYIFDDFTPHFTLLNPYSGSDGSTVAGKLCRWFDGVPEQIELKSVCLVLQQDPNGPYTIYREYRLGV